MSPPAPTTDKMPFLTLPGDMSSAHVHLSVELARFVRSLRNPFPTPLYLFFVFVFSRGIVIIIAIINLFAKVLTISASINRKLIKPGYLGPRLLQGDKEHLLFALSSCGPGPDPKVLLLLNQSKKTILSN